MQPGRMFPILRLHLFKLGADSKANLQWLRRLTIRTDFPSIELWLFRIAMEVNIWLSM